MLVSMHGSLAASPMPKPTTAMLGQGVAKAWTSRTARSTCPSRSGAGPRPAPGSAWAAWTSGHVLPHTAPTAAVRPGRRHGPGWAQAPRVPACAAGRGRRLAGLRGCRPVRQPHLERPRYRHLFQPHLLPSCPRPQIASLARAGTAQRSAPKGRSRELSAQSRPNSPGIGSRFQATYGRSPSAGRARWPRRPYTPSR
jgi:hypothetical protein